MGAGGRDRWSTLRLCKHPPTTGEAAPPCYSARSITLCCRDVVNLNIAAGGGVNLEPVWQALASHIKWVLRGFAQTLAWFVQLVDAV